MCELFKVGVLNTHADSCRFRFSSLYALQIQMYQLSRLLHDYHRELYNHLEENEISPSLYAAPWFLTLFASQFPLGFVARVFGKKCLFFSRDSIFCLLEIIVNEVPIGPGESKVLFKCSGKELGSYELVYICAENLENTVFKYGLGTDCTIFWIFILLGLSFFITSFKLDSRYREGNTTTVLCYGCYF